ncbi:MAG TPA: hypothetical protein VMV57_00380 [Terracidiphilus sp.]|nr:hypothetical protein [Terracidiphilus sp.]
MQPTAETASSELASDGRGFSPARRKEDLSYQVITIASILLVLLSVWVF